MIVCSRTGCSAVRFRSPTSGRLYEGCRDHISGSQNDASSTTDAATAATESHPQQEKQ